MSSGFRLDHSLLIHVTHIRGRMLTLCFFFYGLVAVTIYFLARGDFAGVGSDFSFYFDRLLFFRDHQLPLSDWFSVSLDDFDSSTGYERLSNWIPTPFYSIIFLSPFLLIGSQALFAFQGVIIATITARVLLKNIEIYLFPKFHTSKLSYWFLALGSLNPSFLKDSLTSGPTSICNLFCLLAIRFWHNCFFSSAFFASAAMVRSSYMIYWLSALAAVCIVIPSKVRPFLVRTWLSVVVYIVFYFFCYSTYPGNGLVYIFCPGEKGMQFVENFFMPFFGPAFDVDAYSSILGLHLSFSQFVQFIFSDLRILYGMIVMWFFKILSMLGFMHAGFLVDGRDIWIQRLSTLFYFALVQLPGFVSAAIFALFVKIKGVGYWRKGEKLIALFALIFVGLHAAIMGSGRYGTAISWILVFLLIRVVSLFRGFNSPNSLSFSGDLVGFESSK